MKIAVITPVSHLSGIEDLLSNKGKVFYLEYGSKKEVKSLLLKEGITTIVCNPNHQSYKIDQELLDGTKVRLINTCSTGLNHIDLEYCDKKSITIYSLKDDYELINQLPSTAELAFTLMMCLLRRIPQCISHVANGGWDYTQFMGRQVKDLTIGIVGFGRLGRMMARYCGSFGANVLVYDPPLFNYMGVDNPMHGVNHANTLDDLFKKCDVISLHVHVSDETKYMINKNLIKLSKKDLYIINTSRGEIVNENDIVNSLRSGHLYGYGTDVVEDEFENLQGSVIINGMNEGLNIITTPHIGGMTIEGQQKAYTWAINKL